MAAAFLLVTLIAVYAVTSELAVNELLSPATREDCCRRCGQEPLIPLTLAQMARHTGRRCTGPESDGGTPQ